MNLIGNAASFDRSVLARLRPIPGDMNAEAALGQRTRGAFIAVCSVPGGRQTLWTDLAPVALKRCNLGHVLVSQTQLDCSLARLSFRLGISLSLA